jgi:toxin FitB
MWLLDTNVLSEIRKIKLGTAHPNLVAWADRVNPTGLYLSAVTVFEMQLGISRLERKDQRQGAMLRRWLETAVFTEFQNRILPFDSLVAQRCAKLHVPDPRSERDAMIAATALVHGLIVVTRNMTDFESTGVSLLNPWDDQETRL